MGRTRVVNIRKEAYDAYIGRAGHGMDGYFGNPFRLEPGMARGDTLDRYRKYFYHRLGTDEEFRNESKNCRAKRWGVSASRILATGTSSRNIWTAWLKMRKK